MCCFNTAYRDPIFLTGQLAGKWQTFGTLGNPNWTGEFLAAAALVCLGRLIDLRKAAAKQPLTITVKNLVVTNRLLPDGFVGQPYAATLKVAGGQAPYRFSGSPPKGLQLDPITGELSGKPLSSSAYDR